MSRPIRLVLAAVVAVLMLCCDGSASSESRIGNLGDRSYGGLRSRPPRPSASGEPLDMTRFDGRFVWADYAAPWCSTCSRQVPELEQVRGFLGSDIGFMTVLTSDMGGYGDPASEDLTSMAVPRHVLFSPEGHMLFEWTGYFSAEQILEVTERRMADWEAWKRSGTRAHWMTGGES
jgi:hypothetical protein